ncbi:MAG: hypothetical protein WBV39_05290 [Rudaea sp.]
MSKIVFVVALSCIVVAAGLYLLAGKTTQSLHSPSSPSAPKTAASRAPKLPANADRSVTSKVSSGHTPDSARSAYYDLYEHAKNLNNVIDRLKSAADEGDVSAEGLYAQALWECFPLVSNPLLLEDRRVSNEIRKKKGMPPIPDITFQTFFNRCQELAASGKDSVADFMAKRQDAAAHGDPLSAAIRFTETAAALSPQERQDELTTILQTQNPYAISVLAELMNHEGYGRFSGSEADKYAWKFVACDMGMDCSSTSMLVTHSCLLLGLCGYGDYRNIVQESALAPAEFQQALLIERQILNAFKSGDYEGVAIDQ